MEEPTQRFHPNRLTSSFVNNVNTVTTPSRHKSKLKSAKKDKTNTTGSSESNFENLENNLFHPLGFPLKALEPKVLVPFQNPPGGVPRKIVIERTRRFYDQQNVEELLKKEGIDFSQPHTFKSYLPLEAFDNSDFDTRTPNDWLELGKQDDKFYFVPAQALIFDSDKCGTWKSCKVIGYNEQTFKYIIEVDSTQVEIPKIYLQFLAEDPILFVKRMVTAFKQRKKAEILLRYNLYIENMPMDDADPLDERTLQNVAKLALNDKNLKQNESMLPVNPLLHEINSTYGKCMNNIVFDTNMKDPSQQEAFHLEIPEAEQKKPVPFSALVPIAPYEFTACKKKFEFQTYLGEIQIFKALFQLQEELIQKEKTVIFSLPLKKTLALDEFEQTQTQSIDKTFALLKDQWLKTLVSIIKTNLSGIGKGWLNMHEKSRDIYEMSKLKRFLSCVRYKMEDCLRIIMTASLEEYVNCITDGCNYDIAIENFVNVKIQHRNPEYCDTLPRPMFVVELNLKANEFQYNVDPDAFTATILRLFDKAVADLQKIPHIEPMIMEQFFWSEIKYLTSFRQADPMVQKWRSTIATSIEAAVEPLKKYLSLFEKYKVLSQLSIAEYIKEYEAAEHSLEDVKEEMQKWSTMKKDIIQDIPPAVSIGTFQIEAQSARNFLSKKCVDVANAVLTFVSKLAKVKCDAVREAFQKISVEAAKEPANIEQLAKTREFLSSVPKKITELEEGISEMKHYYDSIDQFKFLLPDEEFKNKIAAITWPKKLSDQVEKIEQELVKKAEEFKEKMLQDQELFDKEIDATYQKVSSFSKYTDINQVQAVAKEVKLLQQDIKQHQAKAKDFNNKEVLFGANVTEYKQLSQMVRHFTPFADMWLTSCDWVNWHESWFHDPFDTLDATKINDDVKRAEKTLIKCQNQFKELPAVANVAKIITNRIHDFKPKLPLLTSLRNPGMRDRHWISLSESVGITLSVGENGTIKTLEDVFAMGLQDHLDKIQKVSDIASKEYTIEKALTDMKAMWVESCFEIKPYRNTGTFVMKVSDEIQQQLDDNIALTQTIGFSAFKKFFEEEITQWDAQLNLVSEIIEEWMTCQREWIALEPIFSAPEMQKQLPQLHKKFVQVDGKWRKIMDGANKNPNIMNYCTTTRLLLKTFQENNVILSSIQKGLNLYLETKRKQFARLYFLADDELLKILAESKEPRAVQPYLKKCFENIEKIRFQPSDEMTSMFSREGEEIQFVEGLYPKGSVEVWLKEVEKMMCGSIKKVLNEAVVDYAQVPRTEWVLRWPGQVIIVGSQIFWTKETAESIETKGRKGLEEYYETLKQQLVDITKIVSGHVSKLDRIKLGALITIDVHARDVIEQMIKEDVNSTSDFNWVSQMRYYWEEGDCKVKQVEAHFVYGYEYLGNTSRLVITPLTDRIYLTLTGALHLNLGGAPAGPAGTGKTETVKDLAKALAKQCVVFNCQEGLDEFAMGKFFKGLVMAGAWACFDEFNRIDVEVLSVVAQQITTLQEAVRAGLETVEFENTTVNVDPGFAVFITMNPGYAGRTELPDNLKALFRPVACMVPDYALIAEIRLFSFGFSDAKALAQKMVATFKLSSEQLSSQDHYDFGMRAVNTVIAAAGLLKRDDPTMNEELLLLRALRDSNLPKFLANDVILFNGIISDLFPGVAPPVSDYGALTEALQEGATKLGLQLTDTFKIKCLQLYETTILRHGLMLVGQTGGGKTSCYKTLSYAMTQLSKKKEFNERFKEVKKSVVNPKSVTMSQLYGEYDRNTREFNDGILASEFRRFAEQDTSDTKKWLIFDGPVDALWIESMNTVLDENKKLCLVSGAIIDMSPSMTIMFEVEDLEVASPATVSRCGMVYMDPKTCVPLESHMQSWYDRLTKYIKKYEDQLRELITKLLAPALEFLRYEPRIKEYVPSTDANVIQSFLKLYDCLLAPYNPPSELEDLSDDKVLHLGRVYEALFVFALIWSVGGTCDQESRRLFDTFIKELMTRENIATASTIPTQGIIYDYLYNEESCEWIHWLKTIPDFELDSKKKFKDIIVPTTDTVRYTWLLDKLIMNRKHILCVGPTGTGKSLIINEKIMKNLPDNFVPIPIFFSARTHTNRVQDIIDGKCEKRRKGVFGPPAGKDYILFIDDMNMPAREQYGAQPPIELLRQWMDHHGWYEYKGELKFREIEKISFIGAMGPPGGGRNPVTNRFLRHFNFIAFPEMDDENMNKIFATILDSFIKANFPEELCSVTQPIVTASIALYNRARLEMLPTPSKSHYTFNLRDLAKVVQGILDVDPKKVPKDGIEPLVRLWSHECCRVFKDRLVNDEDRSQFTTMMYEVLEDNFKIPASSAIDSKRRLIFGDFMGGSDKKSYEEVTDETELVKVMVEQLDMYNSTSDKQMNLVMFLDAIEHVSRISRILRQPGGNALLLGVGGSGRQSLTRLAAYMSDFKLFQVEITKTFGVKEWRDFLKTVILAAGLEENPVVFLFCDTQILYQSFLEDINNLLNSGDVPNLMEPADLENIYAAMKSICAMEKLPITPTSMFSRFQKKVKENLHIVLAMSPGGEVFRNRLRMFPSLVTCCTIDWFSEWPDDALIEVARAQLSKLNIGSDDYKEKVYRMCVTIHQSVRDGSIRYLAEDGRYCYVTPTSYLELLSTIETLLEENSKKISIEKNRLEVGMSILQATEKTVGELKLQLQEKQPVLKKTQEDIAENMKKIAVDKAAAAEKMVFVKAEEEQASKKKQECQEIADSAEADLSKVKPKLKEALKNINNLKVNDIKEVGSYNVPTSGVKTVSEAVCILLDVAPKKISKPGAKVAEYDYWEPSKGLYNDANNLKQRMVDFPDGIDKVPEKRIKAIEKYYNDENFTAAKVAKNASAACVAMCEWVRAMYDFYIAKREVEPKERALAAAKTDLQIVEERLEKAQNELSIVVNKIKQLEDDNAAAVKKMEELAAEVEACSQKLERSEKLIDGLGGEKARWKQTIAEYDQRLKNIIGDMIICAGSVAYLGVFSFRFRQQLESKWREQLGNLGINFTHDVGILSIADPLQVRSWTQAGLPSDQLSIQNAIILDKSRRWPLLIDPQLQANKWIKNLYKDKSLKVVSFSQKDYIRDIMNAVQFGNPVLLENVGEDIDPAIEPILLKQIIMHSGAPYIRIGEDEIPYNPDFKLFITTKLRNPHYTPETSVKVTLLNFFITPTGLEDQLLATVVQLETPELEQMKINLMLKNVQLNKDLKNLQDNILKMLSENTGDILDNQKLIDTLGESKIASTSIKEQVAEAEKTEKEIDETREKYRPVAYRGSILFFCISDMTNIDPMYQYSLQWFIKLFTYSIENAEKNDDLNIRLKNLIDHFTYSLYNNVCQSLFEQHKLLFSFVLCVRILQGDNKIDSIEWRQFLTGGVTDSVISKPATWLTDQSWTEINALSKLNNFKGFAESVVINVDAFKRYFESATVHKDTIPAGWSAKLDSFQKLLVLRSIRPDKVSEALTDFVTLHLGKQFVEPPRFDLSRSFKDSSNVTPLVFILSPGADPKSELNKFAESQRVKKLESISLGRGTEKKSEQAIKDAIQGGTWVLLQNCHLAVSFMGMLEQIVETFVPENHREFRLWLTSMPNPNFPVSVLQNSVKMTLEPPKGLKSNVMGSYDNFDDNFLEHPTKPREFKKLLFSLCFFHAVIQERRKYGPLGWNIPYEYTTGDLKVCIMQLSQFLEKYDEVPYRVIKFLTGQINYGGRVTDDWDRRTLMTIIENYICPEVLTDDYKFCPVLDEYYSIIPASYSDYITYLQNLPLVTPPDLFGLHENAEITYNTSEFSILTDTILGMQPRGNASGGISRDQVMDNTARDILSKIREVWNVEEVRKKYPTVYEESMNTVLVQEVVRYNKLLKVVKSTLLDLLKAIKGTVVMSEELERIGTSLFNNQVPKSWANVAYPSLMPLSSWVTDLIARCEFIDRWIRNGIPKVFWISGFFFPQGFLTGTLQNYSRKHVIAIDKISYSFEVLKVSEDEIESKPAEGCYIRGLFLEGARWDAERGSLAESNPKELYTSMPIIWLKPQANRKKPSTGIYDCPCYKTLQRAGTLSTTGHSTNYVLTIEVPSDKPQSHWIKRGVALLCGLKF